MILTYVFLGRNLGINLVPLSLTPLHNSNISVTPIHSSHRSLIHHFLFISCHHDSPGHHYLCTLQCPPNWWCDLAYLQL